MVETAPKELGKDRPPEADIWRMTMQSKNRWIDGVLNEASKSEVVLPWARGARRAAMIARRITSPDNDKLKSAVAH